MLVDSTLPEAYRIEGVVGKMSFPCIGEICSREGIHFYSLVVVVFEIPLDFLYPAEFWEMIC